MIKTLAWIVETRVWSPVEAQNFFGSCHLFDPLLHLVGNVISKLKMHNDILSP